MSRRFGCLAGAIVFMFLAFAGCTALAKGDTPVPDVLGTTRQHTEIILMTEGLRIGNVKYDENAKGAHGRVISQNPLAGDTTVANGRVNIVIAGPDLVMAPYLYGHDEDTARASLEDAGLRCGHIERIFDDRVPEGRVISQDHENLIWLPRRTKVGLTISRGPESSPVPPVMGMWDDDAKNFIFDLGFKPKLEREYGRQVEGIVMEQEPRAGEDTRLGDTVKIIVSKGAPLVDVPDVRDMKLTQAIAVLRKAGLVPHEERVRVKNAPVVPMVERQFPQAGASVEQGSGVTIIVWVK